MNRKRHPFVRQLREADSSHILTSAAAGGLIGLAAGLIAMSKSKKKERGFHSAYQQIEDRIEDFGEHALHKGHDLMDRATECAHHTWDHWSSLPRHSKLLLCGILSGGLIGASSILLLRGNHAEEKAGKTASSKGWFDMGQRVLEVLNAHKDKEEEGDATQDVLNLAIQGIKVWKHLNGRR